MSVRFAGDAGRRRLVDALGQQDLVRGQPDLAQVLANVASIESFPKGTLLIKEGSDDNDIFLLLIGRVGIRIKRNEIAQRAAGTHVGEMGAIDPGAKRSASVVAIEDVEAARISESDFVRLADQYPILWRNIALVLGQRLRQRSAFVRTRNETPIIFIGSSTESLPIAREIEKGLAATPVIARVWDKDVFKASRYTLEDLEQQSAEVDFAVLIFGPDDVTLSRWHLRSAPRDNVVFETGMFTGALSHARTIYVVPRRKPPKIPSDLFGLTPLTFEVGKPNTLSSRLQPVWTALDRLVRELGPR
jgi:predicted nucleotide-binding protein